MSSPSSSFEKPPPHRANNPFSERQRDNFPSLDAAFLKNHSIEIESTCSQGSSFLNISIGARAALTEHLRHVAKYGIDGEKNGEEREEAIAAEKKAEEERKKKQNGRIDDFVKGAEKAKKSAKQITGFDPTQLGGFFGHAGRSGLSPQVKTWEQKKMELQQSILNELKHSNQFMRKELA